MGKQKIKYAYYTQFPNYLSTPLLLFFCFFVCSFSQILYFFCIGLGMVFGFWFSGIVTLNLAYNGYSRLMVMVCAPSSRFLPYASRNAKCKKKTNNKISAPGMTYFCFTNEHMEWRPHVICFQFPHTAPFCTAPYSPKHFLRLFYFLGELPTFYYFFRMCFLFRSENLPLWLSNRDTFTVVNGEFSLNQIYFECSITSQIAPQIDNKYSFQRH